jgi:hypothetical protein
MPHTRKRLAAAIVAIGALAIAAPGASAAITDFPVPAGGFVPFGASPFGGNAAGAVGPCSRSTAQGQGAAGAGQSQVCAVLAFVGPSTGQIASVVGPTIIGPAVIGTSVVSAGHVIVQ